MYIVIDFASKPNLEDESVLMKYTDFPNMTFLVIYKILWSIIFEAYCFKMSTSKRFEKITWNFTAYFYRFINTLRKSDIINILNTTFKTIKGYHRGT